MINSVLPIRPHLYRIERRVAAFPATTVGQKKEEEATTASSCLQLSIPKSIKDRPTTTTTSRTTKRPPRNCFQPFFLIFFTVSTGFTLKQEEFSLCFGYSGGAVKEL